MEQKVLEKEVEVVRERREELMPTAKQRPQLWLGVKEEHGKRAKVKGTSGGFKFKATVSVCILMTKPHLPSAYTSIYNNNHCPAMTIYFPALNLKLHTNCPLFLCCHIRATLRQKVKKQEEGEVYPLD